MSDCANRLKSDTIRAMPPNPPEQIQVAIVEDSAGVREGWTKLLNSAAGFQCVGACANGEEALKRLPALRPQVVLMDINLPRLSGIECTRQLKDNLPATQILMVTVHSDNERVFQALKAGASGYLLKRTTPPELLQAIREVRDGGAPMTGEIARKVIEAFHHLPPADGQTSSITPREREILELLSQGLANKEIADRLAISFDTVRHHLRHIYEKLHVCCRTEAAAVYLRSAGRSSAETRLSLI
jgi:DNA-binding NarL/FixJ family response regulator